MVGELDLYLDFFSRKWKDRNAETWHHRGIIHYVCGGVFRGGDTLGGGNGGLWAYHTFHEVSVGGKESNKFVTTGLRNQAQLRRVKPRHDVGLSPVHSLGKVLQSFGLPTHYVRQGSFGSTRLRGWCLRALHAGRPLAAPVPVADWQQELL